MPRASCPSTEPLDLTLASWSVSALCAQIGTDPWFPEGKGKAPEAKRICRRCPVREPCLEEALRLGDEYGVRGGLSPRERRRILREAA